MARQPENILSHANATSAQFGAPGQWGEHGYTHPRLGEVKGKVFLREILGLSGMEVSLNALPPGGACSFLHAHKQNEELYVFLSGEGEFQVDGKVFLREILGLSGMEVSLNALPPGGACSFLHAHKQNEELYVFLSGEGEFQVDGKVFPVEAGSAVRVAPEGMRAWRPTGSEPLSFLVIQVKAGSLE